MEIKDIDPKTYGYNSEDAIREGWAISETSGSSSGRQWELQRIDEMMKFSSDYEAWLYVRKLAQSFSPNHKAALDFLKDHEPDEYNEIMNYSE